MQVLSATDALSPAFARTKLVLFAPFRWGRSWKLAITGYLSFAGTFFLPFPLAYLVVLPHLDRVGHKLAYIAAAAILLLTLLFVAIFILCSRLQFAFFDIVLNRGEFVAPAWRKYGAIAARWTSLKILLGTGATVIIGVCLFPFMRGFFTYMASAPHGLEQQAPGQLPPAQFLHLMMVFYTLYFGAFFLFGLYYLLMSTASSFMVPSMALEGLPPRAAFERMVAFIRQQPGSFLGFVGLRVALGIAGYITVALAYEIVLVIVAILCALLGWAVYLVLHALHVPAPVLIGLLAVAGVLLIVGFSIYVAGLFVGTFFTFFEAHTLYFLGGRYPLLGDLVDRSTPPPPYMPPPVHAWPAPYPPPAGWPPPSA